MMDDVWICVEEDNASSPQSFCDSDDSDIIDSETEAELYSMIHYEANLSNSHCENFVRGNIQTSEVPVPTSDNMNIFHKGKNWKNVQTENNVNSEENKKLPSENMFFNKLAQKLKPAKKKKSVSDHNVSTVLNSDNSGLNQSSKHVLNNKRKNETDHSLLKKCSSSKKINASIDSSDSDSSVIWTEVDSTVKDFQTNLNKDEDTINLSCDSDSESITSLSCMKKESILKNLSMPNIKIGESSEDLWYINDEDLYRQKKNNSRRRYHDSIETMCSNCCKKGHTNRTCLMPKIIKCFVCGGPHLGAQCANRICSKCYNVGHDSKRCWQPCISYCTLCSMKGHVKENCPDIWRRYHLTTEAGAIVRGKRMKDCNYSYCWNCGQCGHFGAICKDSRGPKNCFSTWPCVISYDNPEILLKKRLKSQSGRRNFRKDAFLNTRSESYVTKNFVEDRKNGKKKKKFDFQRFKGINKVLREKDFPRSPKNNSSLNQTDDTVPEIIDYLSLQKLKNKQRNLKRRLKRRQKFLNASDHNLQADT